MTRLIQSPASDDGTNAAGRSTATSSTSSIPQDLTPRALLGGLLVGSLLCFTNLYFGLQSAWITMASMQAALVGFGLFKLVPTLPRRLLRLLPGDASVPLSPAENTVLQATAVALGSMPLTTGLIGIVPAFSLLDPARDGDNATPIRFSLPSLLAWSAALAYFGVFFASPLRVPFILREKLRFPSGTATAQLIGVLHHIKIPFVRGKAVEQPPQETPQRQQQQQPKPASPGIGNGSSVTDEERMIDWENDEAGSVIDGRVAGAGKDRDDDAGDNDDVEHGWKPLMQSFAASASFTLLSYFLPVLYALPIFDVLSPHHDLASRWGWWFTPSLSYVGQGVIMGLPTTASMFAGALFGWGILSPLADARGWTDGAPPMDAEKGARAWILWPCLAIMTSESIVGLGALLLTTHVAKGGGENSDKNANRYHLLSTDENGRGDGSGPGAHLDGDEEEDDEDRVADEADDDPSRLTPPSWITFGLIASSGLAVGLLWALFASRHIAPWTMLLGIALAGVLAVLGVRALGATDLNPVNALGKLSQLVFAVVQPHNVLANMIGGALSEAGAMQAGELMQDYKTGHLVGASPRGQFLGQLVGSSVGIVVSSLAYKLYESSYTIPGPEMPAPAGRLWLNFARLVNRGHLPPHTPAFMAVLGGVFAITGGLKTLAGGRATRREEVLGLYRARRARRRGIQPGEAQEADDEAEEQRFLASRPDLHPAGWEKLCAWLPNGIAFAVGLGLNTPNFSIARLVGGALAAWVQRREGLRSSSASGETRKGTSSKTMHGLPPVFLLVLSAGFVLGEGFASIVVLGLKQAGAQPLSCAGCRGGCGGGCN